MKTGDLPSYDWWRKRGQVNCLKWQEHTIKTSQANREVVEGDGVTTWQFTRNKPESMDRCDWQRARGAAELYRVAIHMCP